jgi:hypothetical protein
MTEEESQRVQNRHNALCYACDMGVKGEDMSDTLDRARAFNDFLDGQKPDNVTKLHPVKHDKNL